MRCSLVLLLLLAVVPASAATSKLTASETAAKIDEFLAARWRDRGVPAAPLADDATFLRRAYLDVIGRIPDLVAVRDFLDDPAPDKRARMIESLLKHPRYDGHWANVWREWVLADAPRGDADRLGTVVDRWFRRELKSNTPYDQLVRRLLIPRLHAPNAEERDIPLYEALQSKPESLAAATSRLFLGVKLECAQCHNHPFARWTKQQFWEYAAFFTKLSGDRRVTELLDTAPPLPAGVIRVAESDRLVRARLLDGREARWKDDPREALLDWMLARDNPYFARAAVNRYWEYLLGTGLIEPVDEESTENPPSHPALLDLLSQQFVAHDFDLQYLLRVLLTSRAYQLASTRTHPGQDDPRLFARASPRGLSAEQLYDSVATAAGKPDVLDAIDHSRLSGDNDRRNELRRRFPTLGKRTQQETSSLQALHWMNGEVIAKATRLDANRDLAILADSREPAARRVEQMYLIVLGRKPTAEQREKAVRYIESGGPSKDQAKAVRDVYWALLNTAEFQVNH